MSCMGFVIRLKRWDWPGSLKRTILHHAGFMVIAALPKAPMSNSPISTVWHRDLAWLWALPGHSALEQDGIRSAQTVLARSKRRCSLAQVYCEQSTIIYSTLYNGRCISVRKKSVSALSKVNVSYWLRLLRPTSLARQVY